MTTTAAAAGSFSGHLLVVPYPAQGHLLPLLDLARQLSAMAAARSLPLSITVVVTPKNLPLLSPLLSSSPSVQPLVLPSSSSSAPEHVSDLSSYASVASLIHALSLLSPQILSWARSLLAPPTALLSDFFLGWTVHLARHLSVPRINFSPSAALGISVFDAVFRNGAAASAEGALPPPLPSIPYDHLPSVFRRCRAEAGVPEWDFVADSMSANAGSYATVINSFDALESDYLDHLGRSYRHDRVWAVGPIAIRGPVDPCLPADVAAWLDQSPQGSVVYACFGSMSDFSSAQLREMALALEESGHPFVWVVRSKGDEWVPEGFEERIEGRGLIIRGWSPQILILNHPSVGGFVTHCGWNSCLEGVSAGLPLVTWPRFAEQYYNERLIVDVLRIGTPVAKIPEEGSEVVGAATIAKAIGEVMGGGKEAEERRRRAKELGEMARSAVEKGGSSYEYMSNLIQELIDRNAIKKGHRQAT